MIFFKALLAGLAGVSLSMADISGIVTDTGSTPISGAVVQLEKGKQKTTTGTDGSFTLKVTTATLPATGTLLPNGFSGRMAGNKLNVTLAKRSVVEIATFNLVGKALSIVHTTLDAGSHFLPLSHQGAGMYLYQVTSGNNGLVLKGSAALGMASGSSVTARSPSSNHPARQARTMATFNDVISVTNTGYLDYRVVAYNSDTSGIEIKMIKSAGTITDADGNEYQTVKIGKQVWMAENLRTTRYNDGSAIPLVADSAAWRLITPAHCFETTAGSDSIRRSGALNKRHADDSDSATPAYCFYNNTANADSIRKFGALYNWYVISSTNPKKIAPPGWHVPNDEDWDTLRSYLIANGYNEDGKTSDNTIAKALASKTDWRTHTIPGVIGCDLSTNNMTGFSALPGGGRSYKGSFGSIGTDGYWWSIRQGVASSGSRNELYYGSLLFAAWLGLSDCDLNNAFSIRLLRDH